MSADIQTYTQTQAVSRTGVEARQDFPDISMKSELICSGPHGTQGRGSGDRHTDRHTEAVKLVGVEGRHEFPDNCEIFPCNLSSFAAVRMVHKGGGLETDTHTQLVKRLGVEARQSNTRFLDQNVIYFNRNTSRFKRFSQKIKNFQHLTLDLDLKVTHQLIYFRKIWFSLPKTL